MQEYLLGIDAGTSGVKAIVMDTAGVICGSGYQECDVITPRPSWAEQRPATSVDMEKVVANKDHVVRQLTGGVGALLRSNGVTVVKGEAALSGEHEIACGGKTYTADSIILCGGSVATRIPIPGIDNEKFLTVADILDGRVLPGRNVLNAGGGLTGCETADFLCEHNRIVSVMEMAPVIAADAEATPRRFLMQRLNKWSHALDFYGPALSVYTGAKIKQFYDDGVAYEMGGEVKELHGFDSIILSLGVKSYNPLEEVAKSLCGEVYVVGDAESAGNANHATDTGLAAALKL